MNIIPLYDRVIVEKIIEEEKTGNIFIPKSENNLSKGLIRAIGNGKIINNGDLKPLLVKVNDKILFKENYNIEKYKFENINYYIIKESDIFCIINEYKKN